MNVGELRKALEGVPDDMIVAHHDEAWFCVSTEAAPKTLFSQSTGYGDYVEWDCERGQETIFNIE